MIKKKPIEIQDWENEGGACRPQQVSLNQIPFVQRAEFSFRVCADKFTSWTSKHPVAFLALVILFGAACVAIGSAL